MDDSQYGREFLDSLHETAIGLHKIGVISDIEMREYDQNCLDREDESAPKSAQKPKTAPVKRAHPASI
jgi:DNA-binding transcriptional regulator YiaG